MSAFLTRRTPPPPAAYVWQSSDRLNNGSSCLIRTVRHADLTVLADVLTRCFHPQTGLMGWMAPVFRLGIYEDLRHRLYANDPHAVCLVAVDGASVVQGRSLGDGLIVGTVEMALRYPPFWYTHRQRYLYISNLAVHPEYRRQGIAHRLLQSCEHIAKDWGYSDMYLHVLDNNRPARCLYEKLGFSMSTVDFSLSAFMLRRPQQLLLQKSWGNLR